MARARNIKPGFFANDELVDLPMATRLLFIGLWTIADRAGRLADRPKKIKMAIFPADDVDVSKALDALQSSEFLLRYQHDGERYIQILAFDKHQNPHKDEKQSTIPAPCKLSADTEDAPKTNDGNRADSFNLIPDTGLLIPDTAPARDIDDPFEKTWLAYPPRPGASKKDSLKAWKARIKAGATADEIHAGVLRYAEYVIAKQPEPEYIKQPATFFGPGDHYKSKWIIPHPHGSPSLSQLGKAGQETAAAAQRLIEKWEAENEQEDRL